MAKGVRDGAGKIPGSPEQGMSGAGPGLRGKARQVRVHASTRGQLQSWGCKREIC